jgi:hypothetical protein
MNERPERKRPRFPDDQKEAVIRRQLGCRASAGSGKTMVRVSTTRTEVSRGQNPGSKTPRFLAARKGRRGQASPAGACADLSDLLGNEYRAEHVLSIAAGTVRKRASVIRDGSQKQGYRGNQGSQDRSRIADRRIAKPAQP